MSESGKANNPEPGRRILIAPMDWGLGHATRCIPLIKSLIHNGMEVILAGEGAIKDLLVSEFPGLRVLPLPGYRIHYGRSPFFLIPRLLVQIPRALRIFRSENKRIRDWVASEKIDAVISDNRPGIYHPGIPSVYITHQVHMETGSRLLGSSANRFHRKFINAFDECWIPDLPDPPGLAGELSHPRMLPEIPVYYTGPLSRFVKKSTEPSFDLLAIISGPEPRRTLFEKKLLSQLAGMKKRIAMVRGLPGKSILPDHPGHITLFNHLDAKSLNHLICSSEQVIARAGYSTIMDLAVLGKKALLVPTPGQTEQEYLAKIVRRTGLFASIPEKDLMTERDLQLLNRCPGAEREYSCDTDQFVKNWLKRSGLIR